VLSCQFRDGVAWAVVLSPAFVSGPQLVGALRALERAAHFPRGTGLLVDGRAVGDDARGHTVSELSSIAFEMGVLGIDRCAVVPAPTRVSRAERFANAARKDGLTVSVFLDPEEAVRWLRAGRGDQPSA
jgi:hypothetical protein